MTRTLVYATVAFSLVLSAQDGKMEGSVHRAARPAEGSGGRSMQSLRSMARSAPRYALGRLNASEARPVTRKPGLTPVGINRSLPQDVVSQGEWSTSPEGKRVWRLTLTSADAEAMRVHFQDFHVGDGNVWLLGPDDAATTTGPYSKDGLLGDGEFWSDLVEGDSLTVLYEPADDSAVDTVPFWPSAIAHRFPSMIAKASSTQSAAASCNVDVTCHPEYADAASAVALMVFESNDGTYECTGSLVSSASKPALPFFLTANHCISTAAEARSLITFFNYQTSSCNGTKPTLSNSARVTGATFVDGQDMSLGDFTLLRLTAFPNIDVKVLGWTGDEIASNEQVTGISHPLGDYKRIALGQRTRDVSIRFSDGARMPANKGYQVAWFEGVTQGGSSGSPLLVNVNGKTYVAGTLSAGPDVNEDNSAQVCRASNLIASYGRFSAALPYLESYLRSVDGAVSMSSTPSITATPVTSGGRTTLTWQANGPTQVQIRVGSPTGPAMTGLESPIGSAQTGDWAVDGMIFYLQDASDGNSLGAAKTLASVRAQAAIAEIKDGAITASPNPIRVAAGQTRGATTLNWRATGVRQVQIRVGSPTGSPMTGFESVTGSTSTGNWVTNGLTFYLQDASDGNSAGSAKTLATIRVTLSNR